MEAAMPMSQEKAWWRTPHLIKLYALLMAAIITPTSWGFDLSMTNGLQSVRQFMTHFGNPAGATLGLYGASASVGGVVAMPCAGYLVDKFGRRFLCALGSAIVIGMVIMESFSTSFHMFTAAKLILGFGATLQQVGGPVLVTELAYPKQRVALTSVYNTSIYIGMIIGAWIAYATESMPSNWSWRIPCLLQLVLPTYQLSAIYFCPESPRWLVSKGRVDEARQILIKFHGGGVETDVVHQEYLEILAGVEADKSSLKFNKEGIKTVLKSRGNLKRLFLSAVTAVGSQCAGSGLISSYLPAVLDQVGLSSSKEKTLINGILNIWSWVIGVIAAIMIPYVRRRMIFLVGTTGMLCAFSVWTALSARYVDTSDKNYGIGVVAMMFVYNLFYSISWLPLTVAYPVEVVTTKQRGVFFSWTMFCITGSSFAVNYINPIGIDNISWRYYCIQTVFIFVLLVIIYATFVETKGLSLEKIAILFDGQETFDDAEDTVVRKVDGNLDTKLDLEGFDENIEGKQQQVAHIERVPGNLS